MGWRIWRQRVCAFHLRSSMSQLDSSPPSTCLHECGRPTPPVPAFIDKSSKAVGCLFVPPSNQLRALGFVVLVCMGDRFGTGLDLFGGPNRLPSMFVPPCLSVFCVPSHSLACMLRFQPALVHPCTSCRRLAGALCHFVPPLPHTVVESIGKACSLPPGVPHSARTLLPRLPNAPN